MWNKRVVFLPRLPMVPEIFTFATHHWFFKDSPMQTFHKVFYAGRQSIDVRLEVKVKSTRLPVFSTEQFNCQLVFAQ